MKNIKILTAVFSLVFAFALTASAQSKTLISLDGENINIEGQKGKITVLAIGASWLPLSKNQVETVNKLAKKYANKNVVFYFVATDSTNAKSKNFASNDELKKFVEKNKLTVATLRDSDGMLTIKNYKIDQLPAFIILGKDGVLATEPIGGIDPVNDISISISAIIDKNM
ncbi:MAG: peroxiredoxin family protein [Pyrinomonadaceae bacterium]